MIVSGSGYSLGYSQIATASNGSIGLPVSGQSLIYSFYKHVHGYSVKGDTPTVPVSKIRILNNLIDNLTRMKSEKNTMNLSSDITRMSSENMEHLINDYASELHRLVLENQTGFNAVETGMVVSLSA